MTYGTNALALAIQDGDAYVWYWIGDHDEYERMLAK